MVNTHAVEVPWMHHWLFKTKTFCFCWCFLFCLGLGFLLFINFSYYCVQVLNSGFMDVLVLYNIQVIQWSYACDRSLMLRSSLGLWEAAVHVMCEKLWFGTKVMYTPLFFWLQFVFCDYLGIYRTNNILQVDWPITCPPAGYCTGK
jgi:hypothetical protein